MKKILVTASMLMLFSWSVSATDYYVSSVSGSDSNSGTSAGNAWKTLNKVSGSSFSPGDRILFKRGETFIGQLNLQSSGNASNPIIIAAFGSGDKPIINGSTAPGGDYEAAILIENQHYVEVRNLEITNNRLVSRPGNDDKAGHGIYVHNTGNQTMNHFVFDNLTLRGIYAIDNNVGFDQIESGAIFLETERNLVPGQEKQIRDVTVNNCYFTDIEKIGIWTRHRGNQQGTSPDSLNKNWNYVITNNHTFRTGGSGVVLSRTFNALVENNRFEFTGDDSNPRMAARGSGAWFFATQHTIVQHNVSIGARGPEDSYGMHIDSRNTYIILQYNYSEDAQGGFAEILGGNTFATYRYNISVNEGFRSQRGNTFWISDFAPADNPRSDEVYIYNNSIYVNETTTGANLNTGISLKSKNAYIYNNLIATGPKGSVGQKEFNVNIASGSTLSVSNNVYNGTVVSGFTNLDSNPTFGSAGYVNAGGTDPEDYKLQTNSAALNGSLNFSEPPFPHAGQGIFAGITADATEDFFGNPVNMANSPHVGAFNGTPVPGSTTLSLDTDLEAEDATKFGTAITTNCAAASNGALALQFFSGGPTNRIEFQNLDVPTSGIHTVTLSYIATSDRTFSYRVNGGTTVVENVTTSGLSCFQGGTPTDMTFDVFLPQGLNDIAFFDAMVMDKIRVTPQSALRFEAEDASLSGTAGVVNCSNASEGLMVSQANGGANNAILFNAINANQAGTYTVRLSYFAAVPITASLEINGGSPQTVNLPVTGSWCFQGGSPGVIDVPITLTAGNNTLKIFNINVLDYVDVFGLGSAPAPPVVYEAEDATLSGSANIATCNTASNNEMVLGIFSSSGADAVTFNVNVPSGGTYEVTVGHISTSSQTIAYELNGGTAQSVSVSTTGLFCYQGGSPADFDITLSLNSGNNTLKFYDMGPLDRIIVSPVGSSARKASSDQVLSLEDPENNTVWKLYPNPTKDYVEIYFGEAPVTDTKVGIYDLSGSLLLESSVFNLENGGTYRLDLKEQNLAGGTVLLTFTDEEGKRRTKRLVIER